MPDRALILIPARAGSRGIPGKNIRPLNGFPLVEWAIASAIRSGVGEVAVSSDSPEILRLAGSKGSLCIPIRRPEELAEDQTPDLPVMRHALYALGGGLRPQMLIHLRPTSPFVMPEEIVAIAGLLSAHHNLSAVRSVVRACCHPQKLYVELGDFGFPMLRPYTDRHAANHPRQGLEPVWRAAGFVDAFRVWALESSPKAPDGDVIGRWEAPRDRSVDLDTEADWRAAEAMTIHNGWTPGEICPARAE